MLFRSVIPFSSCPQYFPASGSLPMSQLFESRGQNIGVSVSTSVMCVCMYVAFPGGKESTCQCRRHGFYPWVGKILWSRKWQPTPVFLPGKFHEHRSLYISLFLSLSLSLSHTYTHTLHISAKEKLAVVPNLSGSGTIIKSSTL